MLRSGNLPEVGILPVQRCIFNSIYLFRTVLQPVTCLMKLNLTQIFHKLLPQEQ